MLLPAGSTLPIAQRIVHRATTESRLTSAFSDAHETGPQHGEGRLVKSLRKNKERKRRPVANTKQLQEGKLT